MTLIWLISSVFATLNSTLLPFQALNSRLPSSFDPLYLINKQKHSQRLLGGRGNHRIDRGVPADYDQQLAKQFSLSDKIGTRPTPFSDKLPPLNPSVRPVNGAGATSFLAPEEINDEEDSSTMPVSKFTKSALGARYNKQDRTYTVPKDKFNECLDEIRKLRELNGELSDQVRGLEKEVADLEASAKKKPNSSKSSRKVEQNEDVVKAVGDFVRDVLFRNVKFAPPGAQLRAACGMVWKGIKDKLKLDQGPRPLSQSDFEEIYGSAILSALSGRRQYVQTRSEIAAKGKKCCVLLCGYV